MEKVQDRIFPIVHPKVIDILLGAVRAWQPGHKGVPL